MDSSALNLYDTETGGFGTADVTVIGPAQGVVRGSLVVDQAGDQITFIRTGGILAPDTYTVNLRSDSNGFKDKSGDLLDGNNDGTGGDDFHASFTIAPSTVVVGMPDFMRAAGQSVDVPATNSGLPITISNGAGIISIVFTLKYDPAFLINTFPTRGANVPAGSSVTFSEVTPGQLQVVITSPTPWGVGPVELFRLNGFVSPTPAYKSTDVVSITNLSVNGGAISAVGDVALQLNALFGDATGNGTYSSLDAQRVLRVAAGLDSGFAAYPTIDPVIIADINGAGRISSIDATRILQEVVGLNRPEIPPIVASASSITTASPSTTDLANSGTTTQFSQVPYLTSNTSIENPNVSLVTNSIADISQSSSLASNDISYFDDYMSDQLTKSTGKSWRFVTLKAVQ